MSDSGVAEGVAEPFVVGFERRYAVEHRRERELVKAAKKGSADAIEELVRTYWGDAHRIALGVLADPAAAEDVAQEALLAAVGSLAAFDPKRPFRPWLHRIATNRALDHLRARQRRAESELPAAVSEVRAARAHDALSEALLDALRDLRPDERAIVVLRHLLGLNSREIGEVLEVPEGTVRSTLSRALAQLRERLGEEEEEEVIDG